MQRNATELKPDPLTSDADFDDFCIWRRKLEDYFDAAGYDQLKPRTQRAYLKNCLSDDLNGTLEKYLEVPNTASVAETLKRLEEYFARLTSIVEVGVRPQRVRLELRGVALHQACCHLRHGAQ